MALKTICFHLNLFDINFFSIKLNPMNTNIKQLTIFENVHCVNEKGHLIVLDSLLWGLQWN